MTAARSTRKNNERAAINDEVSNTQVGNAIRLGGR